MTTLGRYSYTLATFISLALFTVPVLAASSKTIQQQFDVSDLATLELNIFLRVGMLLYKNHDTRHQT